MYYAFQIQPLICGVLEGAIFSCTYQVRLLRLLPRHADDSKLSTKQLRFNIKYILTLNSFYFWDSSTILQSSQGNWWKYLVTVSPARYIVTLVLN